MAFWTGSDILPDNTSAARLRDPSTSLRMTITSRSPDECSWHSSLWRLRSLSLTNSCAARSWRQLIHLYQPDASRVVFAAHEHRHRPGGEHEPDGCFGRIGRCEAARLDFLRLGGLPVVVLADGHAV